MRRWRKELAPEEGEINLTPYLDIVTTLVIFMVFTFEQVIEFRLIPVMAPAIEGPKTGDPVPASLEVFLILVEEGYRLVASDGRANQEIPRLPDGAYDTATLRDTLISWKRAYHLGNTLTLIAEDDMEYDLVIQAMDAVRMDGKVRLFSDVALGAATLAPR